MGMSVSKSSDEVTSEPNVVPLCDILLVLLIIFMVVTPPSEKRRQCSTPHRIKYDRLP